MAAGDIANMRQIFLATEMFCLEHPNQSRIFFAYDRYTGNANRYGYGPMVWTRLLRPYFGENRAGNSSIAAFISPGDPKRGVERPFYAQDAAAGGRRSYSFNIQTLDPGVNLPKTNTRNRMSIEYPARFLFFANHRATYLDTNWIDPDNLDSVNSIPDDWFGTKSAHFAFLDGHIESIPVEHVKAGGLRRSIFFP